MVSGENNPCSSWLTQLLLPSLLSRFLSPPDYYHTSFMSFLYLPQELGVAPGGSLADEYPLQISVMPGVRGREGER